MRGSKYAVSALAVSLAATMAGIAGTGSAVAAPSQDERPTRSVNDNRLSPMAKKQNALRQEALQRVLAGGPAARRAVGPDGVVKVGKGQYVKLKRQGEDRIFVIIAEFGNDRHPNYPDTDSNGDPASDALTFDGPLHNSIPKPNRKVDNTNLWQPNYNRAHYENMYFNRMAKYYESQSSNRYSVTGDVNGWVKVPFNEARYGRDRCGGIVCRNTWFLIRDAMSIWVEGQLDLGKSMKQIRRYLKTFDVQDRYDADADGNFDEPDGFIDHFQIVHAGGDQASGDLQQGSDAIWSHRWYASVQGGGPNGFPGVNAGSGRTSGGVAIPNNPTGVWVGDYTIQPEDGGLGVFAHEFGHDLGLPDLYDTSGNTGGAENSTGFWTLMSSGANIGDGGPDGIGDDPVDLGAWEKFQLGWLKYDVAFAGEKSDHKVGPAEYNSPNAQALFVVLPDKQVPLELGSPCATCGSAFYYSGSGDNLNNTMTADISASGVLSAKVRYDIETDYDYAFVEASTDGGASWIPVKTNRSDTSGDQSGYNSSGTGLTGSTNGEWVDLTSDNPLPAGTNALRFRYQTDGGLALPGFQVDNVAVGGTSVGTAESDEGWTFDGFRMTTGSEIQEFGNYYVAENRGYRRYDKSLKTAYNFGFLNKRPNWVESFPYQDGLLISYWDTSQADNNVGDHPGEGQLLPIDAHPRFSHWYDGELVRPRIASYDSTFGLDRVQSITVHKDSKATKIGSRPAKKVFDDRKDYWFESDPHTSYGPHPGRYQPGWYGVKVPKTGTLVRIESINKAGVMKVHVKPAK